MKENKKFFLGIFVGIVIFLGLSAAFIKMAFENRAIRGMVFEVVKQISALDSNTDEINSTDTTTGAAIDWDKVSRKSNQLYNTIDDYYLNEIDNNKIQDGIYKGMVDSLGDQYTVYYTADEYKQFTTASSGT